MCGGAISSTFPFPNIGFITSPDFKSSIADNKSDWESFFPTDLARSII